jgi:hypothetical protein
MQNDSIETYETPELCELGKAEEVTRGKPDGVNLDILGRYRFEVGILPDDAE